MCNVKMRPHRSAAVFAHELGHACGLDDIYAESIHVELSQMTKSQWATKDWNGNGGGGPRYYAAGLDQRTLINRLLMYGVGAEGHLDFPLGWIHGGIDRDSDATATLNVGLWKAYGSEQIPRDNVHSE